MKRVFKEFLKNKGLTQMGIGMLVGGSFMHVVSSSVNQFVLPLLRQLIPISETVHMNPPSLIPHLTLNHGGFIHTFLVFIIISLTSYGCLKWSQTCEKEGY